MSADSLAAPATPVALLAAWEAAATPAQTAAQLPHQPAVLACLTALLVQLPADINVDLEDARTVLHGAGSLRAAPAAANGPARVAEALRQLRAALPGVAAQRALLCLSSSPAAPLEMDELTELTEAIHAQELRNEGELVFGHGELPAAAPDELRVWLLLAYAPDTPPLAASLQ